MEMLILLFLGGDGGGWLGYILVVVGMIWVMVALEEK